jgi:hypothetical protein
MAIFKEKSRVFRSALFVTWLCLVGWLVRYEAYPEYFSGAADGYQSLIPRNLLLNETWMAIKINDVQSGYTRNVWNVNDDDRSRYYVNENQMYLWIDTGQASITFSTDSKFLLDTHYGLSEFTFAIRIEDIPITLKGTKSKSGDFDIAITTTGSVHKFTAAIPAEAVLFTPLGGMVTRKLKPGQSLTVSSFDPFTMKKNNIILTAVRNEIINSGGTSHKATMVATKVSGLSFYSWIDQSGDIIRQTSPFGLMLERSTMEESMIWTKNRNLHHKQPVNQNEITTLINEDTIRALIDTFMKGTER